MKIYMILFWCVVLAGIVFAQEYVVNTYTDSVQRDAEVVRDDSGNYAVVWTSLAQADSNSERDIYLRFFNSADEPLGPETLVNDTTLGDQEKAAVAMNPEGDCIVVWASKPGPTAYFDIRGQLYKDNLPSGQNFTVNTYQTHSQNNPSVDMRDDGSFVVVWDSWFQDGSDRGVFAQRFDANAAPVADEFQVNTTTVYSQTKPVVEYSPDGGFIVIWESWNQDDDSPSGYGVFGQRFDESGNKTGDEFQINTYTIDYQWYADIEFLADSSFVVAWCSWEQDGDDGGIYMQRFNKSGAKIGNETKVNSTNSFYQWLPRITTLSDEIFAVVWSSWNQDGNREGVYGRLYHISGKEKSFETRLNSTTESFQWEPTAIGTAEDEILAVWSSWSRPNNYDIFSRRMQIQSPQGIIDSDIITPMTGITTTDFTVHVMDTLELTGDTYEMTFSVPDTAPTSMSIQNLNSQEIVIDRFNFSDDETQFYVTPVFEGLALEIRPVFELNIDSDKSYFSNHTGSNFQFEMYASGLRRNIVPIDVALIWKNTDTLANGNWSEPADTALSFAAQIEVEVPFIAWDLTNNQQMDLLIEEQGAGYNQRWDLDERIWILTPESYDPDFGDTHGIIEPLLPDGEKILPGPGDSVYVFTRRPVTEQDTIRFQAEQQDFISGLANRNGYQPQQIELEQNYPNPFNPVTTIAFTLPRRTKINLEVYNLLGQKVITLIDGVREKGWHRITLDAERFASGMYFYTLRSANFCMTRKMLLLK